MKPKIILMMQEKKIIEDIEKKKQTLDKEINIEISKAEAEVAELVNKAPEKIQKIAIETSSDLIRQLIGEEVNNSSISAIVDDLYKKNKGKYYGN
jgi:F-type H+-transporting ATPase subunit b